MNEPQKKNNQPEVDCFSSGGQRPQKKKMGRPFGINHNNPEFWVQIRNTEPVILERDPSWPVFTDERFKYLISKQQEWRHEYLKQKKINTNYNKNKEFEEQNK